MRSITLSFSGTRHGWLNRVSVASFAALTLFCRGSDLSAQILMNEFVADGDGTAGSADPQWVGISSDSGEFQPQHDNVNIQNSGDNPQAVDPATSVFINSVFIINSVNMEINTEGVSFGFQGGDATGDTWNHIIKDSTHDIDKNCADVRSGGLSFVRAIGIHASAGITFDLEEIRSEHGPDQVRYFSSYAGMDRCGGETNLYAIVSDDEGILGSARVGPIHANEGEFMQLEIPEDALFLTLATGGSNSSIGCAHGVFADPLISGAEISLPQRDASNPGDPATCPPTSAGPISVTITQEGGGEQMVTVQESAIGPFDTGDVTAPGANVADNIPDGISDDLTFINGWLLLGPFEQVGGAAPSIEDMQLDYLTDGDRVDDATVEPRHGDTVETDYGGAAASFGLLGVGDINPDGIPTWAAWVDNDSSIDFNNYYGGNVDNVMMYAVTYIVVGDTDIDVNLALSSDDSVQVLFSEVGDDGLEVHVNSVARGLGGPCATPDTVPLGVLAAGARYRLVLKIFEGGGGHGFRARLVDSASGDVIGGGYGISLDPEEEDYEFPPNGVQIEWTVSRDALEDPGLSYDINIDGGVVNFKGDAGGASILGTGVHDLIPAPRQDGPFVDPSFANAHAIGAPCSGTQISSPAGGEIEITAGGVDIWNTADQCMFASSEVTGDFSARVLVSERVMGASTWGKHGIMARENCSAGSAYVYVSDQQDELNGPVSPNPPSFQWRPAQNAGSTWSGAQFPAGVHSDELRLDRCGDNFVGYAMDTEGALAGRPGEWVQVDSYHWPDAPDTLHLGLAVTSHDGCNLVTVVFDGWEVLDSCPGPVQDLVCEENAGGGLDLTWTNPSGADTDVPISIHVDGVEVRTVDGAATSATIDGVDLPAGISQVTLVNSSTIPSTPCTYPPAYSEQGFVKDWLLLGPLAQPTGFGWGAAPSVANIRLDFLSDGVTTQEDIQPSAGDTINTDFGGASASPGLQGSPNQDAINPDGVPTWNAWRDTDDSINFNDYYGGDVNQNVMYAVTYVHLEEDMELDIGTASDDAIQVLIDGEEVWINAVARGFGAPDEVQDTVCADPNVGGFFCSNLDVVDTLLPLSAGDHTILIKVFEGGGGHGFRFRFQDPLTGEAAVDGVSISLDPSGAVPEEICDNGVDDDGDDDVDCLDSDCADEDICAGARFVRGDSNSSDVVDLTDGVVTLNFLFTGGPAPACQDAADTDDNGALVISDAVITFSYLFTGGSVPQPPSPSATVYLFGDCAPDPTDDDPLECATIAATCTP